MTLDPSHDQAEPDIVLVVLQRVRAQVPGLADEVIRQIEADVRAQYGGLRVRIPKRGKHPSATQRAAVLRDALTPASDSEITGRHGISRASLYRYVKRGE